MARSKQELDSIYDRTSGYCHLCRKKLSRGNYGVCGARGAWEVEHSRPRALGGTDRANNRYAACISCNRSKRDGSTRTTRRRNGFSRAPLSRAKRAEARTSNAVGGGFLGGAIGGAAFGPAGAILGTILGATAGHDRNPDNDR